MHWWQLATALGEDAHRVRAEKEYEAEHEPCHRGFSMRPSPRCHRALRTRVGPVRPSGQHAWPARIVARAARTTTGAELREWHLAIRSAIEKQIAGKGVRAPA